VVFDCDGVLVDSERLAVRTEAVILAELGWPLTHDEIVERFVGRSAAYMHAEVERELGRAIDWEAEFSPRYRAVFDAELGPIDGVCDVLDVLAASGTATCVASSSTHRALAYKLELTGLWDRFRGRIFSTDDVANPKPEPDVFLHAASSMGVEPRRCAVIEDSVSGVHAGLAAGMAVFGFAGGVTPRARLEAPGVTVFDAMAGLSAHLAPGPDRS
jgi:HAD superfamily hydrolase (TIGR01509 family)